MTHNGRGARTKSFGFFSFWLLLMLTFCFLVVITKDLGKKNNHFLCVRLILHEMVCCCLVLQETEVKNVNDSGSLPSHGRLF